MWHIDEGQVEAHGFRGDNRVNAGSLHGVSLLQADGLGNLEQVYTSSSSNRGDAGDSYPGSSGNRRITLSSVPSPVDNQNHYAGFVIDSIYQVRAPRPDDLPPDAETARALRGVAAGARIKVNGGATMTYSDVFATGDTAGLAADSLQLAPDGLSRFEFRSWSDGGALAHTYHATAVPDTITATFAAQYRLQVMLVNALPGAVALTAPPPNADLAAGVFLTGGAPVTLTATAPGGTLFAGWSGDTTAASPTLVLPMGRPYNVNATFVTQVAVTVDAAANLLLGTGFLTPEQTAYLDARGNRNGTYDIGDFLAFVRFTGVSPSPGVMQQLLSKAPARPAGKGR